MAFSVFATPLESFWQDQSQKLLAHPDVVSDNASWFDDVCCFRASNGRHSRIDFSLFDLPHFNIESSGFIKINEQVYPLTSKEYAKLFFLSCLSPKSSAQAGQVYQMVLHLFAFLNTKNTNVLVQGIFDDFWTSFLGQLVNEKGFFNRVSTPSYRGAINPISFPRVRNKLQTLGVMGVIDNSLTQKQVERSLDDICKSQYQISLADYKKGGSLNFLGLELGQYYVDYLRGMYQDNFLYMSVCKKTLSSIIERNKLSEIKESKGKSRLLNVFLSALAGLPLDKLQKVTYGISHQEFKEQTEQVTYDIYLQHFDSAMSLKEDCIEALVLELGLGARFDAAEIIRILMLQKYHGLDGHKKPSDVWQGYIVSLETTFLESCELVDVSVDDVYRKMQLIIDQQKLNQGAFLRDLKSWGNKLLNGANQQTYQSFRVALDSTAYAMTNLFIAWTGYRKGEYGFPFNAIRPEPNLDILDNAHVPFRFKLKWLVPKTNKATKIDREITSQCYQISAQLNELFNSSDDAPCLYEPAPSAKKENSNQSGGYIEKRVKANWLGFVGNYQPFNEAVRLDTLLSKKESELAGQEPKELAALLSKYDVKSARYKHLFASAQEIKQDWLRLSNTSFSGKKAQMQIKQSFELYSKSEPVVNKEHQIIIDKYLSDETKSLLQSGTIDLDDVKTMVDINGELLQDVRYPSPHAFRHIWAEAVLTRYQGDVGAVIRHQFCHLDNSFFMAYLREKDTRGLMDSARQRYLNSLVEMLILDAENVGEEYFGGFARYVKKATDLTQAVTESEIRALKERITGRIINIQPSHFSICVPRDGAESRAKCAKRGSLNPQDAKPEFCLNCTNALITQGNVRGIWQTIQPMVIEAMNENGLGCLLEGHLPTLKSGYRRIKELRESNKNKEGVDKVLLAIKKAVKSIEAKLEREAELYG
ncbi:hypothetical protein AB4440_16495 [Vibrio splendidus]|uniref:hypothetical protein n=1 Tax=Vibrio splendidus TaxID=29497 RepID=UPI000C8518F7|nr:hypothetical protein [Vibrio splendidus]PMO94799.1 hypothetical protein BCS97_16180 [Vibrio splendidus]PMP23774.1 hypothetical protein BCS89_15640 [Vibrio splendidus]PMP37961.1 hypothetical protein BCS88_04880 [Vibrio splendidus]PMP39868.1 hypothetical protein BCS87_08975 [Vibrio splendidus]PMP48297.1 hypothetical protein BCS85_09675 [Vibrio splendidus]